jgi:N-acetylglucosamine malate deacetylase 1
MKRITRLLLRRFAGAAGPYLRSYGLLQTSKVFNTSALVWEPGAERVVVLAPHMDDETIGCGGALALHTRAGAVCRVVFLTDGRHGSSQIKDLGAAARRSEELKLTETRKVEARLALETLGVREISFLDVEDGTLSGNRQVSEHVRGILERDKPDLVYVPSFLEQHPDHYAASRILLEAASGSTLEFQCVAYEVWTPLFPNCIVRIDEVVELKKRALAHYRSQLHDMDYLHSAMGLNAYRSAAFTGHAARFAEAFCSMPLPAYRQMFDTYRAPG